MHVSRRYINRQTARTLFGIIQYNCLYKRERAMQIKPVRLTTTKFGNDRARLMPIGAQYTRVLCGIVYEYTLTAQCTARLCAPYKQEERPAKIEIFPVSQYAITARRTKPRKSRARALTFYRSHRAASSLRARARYAATDML